MKKILLVILFVLFIPLYSQEYEVVVYNTQNSNIVSDSIEDFEFDSNGNVWITHGNPEYGLTMFDGNNFHNFTPDINLPENVILSDIQIDHNNNIWVLVWQNYNFQTDSYPIGYSRALLYFDGTDWEYYTPDNSQLPTLPYGRIKTDNLGNVWFITSEGLSKFDGSNLMVYNSTSFSLPTPANFDSNNYLEIVDGVVWVISGYQGNLLSYHDNNWIFYQNTTNIFNYVDSILTVHNGSIYLGSDGDSGSTGGAFIKFDGSIFTLYDENYGNCDLTNDVVPSIFQGFSYLDFDSQGNLWAGYGSEANILNEEIGQWIYPGIKNLTNCTNYLLGEYLGYSNLKIDNNDNIWLRDYFGGGLLKMGEENLNSEEYIIEKKILYPNPVDNEITIVGTANFEYDYFIIDISGKLMQTGRVLHNQPFDVSKLQKGVYFIKIISDRNVVNNYKFIKT